MSAAIIYMSKHGTAEKAAKLLSKKIADPQIDLYNLKKTKDPVLTKYDIVIIGGSIHGGAIQKKIKNFCRTHEDELLLKRTGLYLCCLYRDEAAQQQFDAAFPEELKNNSVCKSLFGSELLFDKMNFFEKLIAKKVSGLTENSSDIDLQEIEKFAQKISEFQTIEP